MKPVPKRTRCQMGPNPNWRNMLAIPGFDADSDLGEGCMWEETKGLYNPRKLLLTAEQQIAHMKSKGVTFNLCSEKEAVEYLTGRTYYFKLAAYRVLFDKRIGGLHDGQYVNLDFGYLKALASLDRDLRYALLPLTLDVEHAARTKLVRMVAEREDENGYSISADYMAHLNHSERRRREGEVNMLTADIFCGDLAKKYGKGTRTFSCTSYTA